jgi:ABC-type uncharacterized transport system substrate-binding protein
MRCGIRKIMLARSTTALIGAVLAAAASALAAPPAAAHPHVWVTVESTLIYEQGSLVGIRHKWTFDEFYTAMAIQGLDTNNDGQYSREELAELAQVNIDGLKDFSYFTYPKLAGVELPVGEVKDYYLEYADAKQQDGGQAAPKAQDKNAAPQSNGGVAGRVQNWFSGKPDPTAAPEKPKALSLHFTLPFKQPVLADAPGFTFTVTDPSFFIAFEFAKHDPIKLGPGAPADCRISIGDAERDAEDAKRLGEAFFKQQQQSGQGFGFSLAKPVAVQCGPKS